MILLFLILSFFQFLYPNTAQKHAEKILTSLQYPIASSIITEREKKELQLDRLVKELDYTKTAFGRYGIKQLLHPINDIDELNNRKKIISHLIENDEIMHAFKQQLKKLHEKEKSLIAYWDKNDFLYKDTKNFYFSLPGLKETLNQSTIALNLSSGIELFNCMRYLMLSLCLHGFNDEFHTWMNNREKRFDFIGGLCKGLKSPLRHHSPYLDLLKKGWNRKFTMKNSCRVLFDGSWQDRYTFISNGSPAIPAIKPIVAFFGATIPTLLFDYTWWGSIKRAKNDIVFTVETLNALHNRVSDVAQCIHTILTLRHILIEQTPELQDYFNIDINNPELQSFLKKLLAPRFLKKSGYIYSPGHALIMHQEIYKHRRLLIPLLQSVAFLDAYCSIAQLHKKYSSHETNCFTFPEFVESETPFFECEDMWLPLLSAHQAINNSITLGNDQPGKIIITGPSGGGKSTILKSIGIIALLAQTGIGVPAKKVRQTLFSRIITSLDTRENLQEDLSTFMAEKKTMDNIHNSIINSTKNDHMLILIDEPYKGIVNVESGKRIYQFCQDIAHYDQILLAIATHIEKPIFLEQDTRGTFGNYHVQIDELVPGIFKRLFKLQRGPAWWWFEDDDKRSRFVDWISTQF